MSQTIQLGALRLTGDPSKSFPDIVEVTIDGQGKPLPLYVNTWQSLVHTAAVVEAAKRWRSEFGPPCGADCDDVRCRLAQAISTLAAGGKDDK